MSQKFNDSLNEYLDSALKATDIPKHKLNDTEFLRASCSIAHEFIKAAMAIDTNSPVCEHSQEDVNKREISVKERAEAIQRLKNATTRDHWPFINLLAFGTNKPVSVSLEKCATAAQDQMDFQPMGVARRVAEAVLDAAGVKYE